MSGFQFSFRAQKIILTTKQTSLVGPVIIPSTSFIPVEDHQLLQADVIGNVELLLAAVCTCGG